MNVDKKIMTDARLIERYVGGDKDAISILIERHTKRVKDYLRMMVRNVDAADDIFQETFIKVVAVIDEGRYVDSGKFVSWVLRIAHNQVIDYFRQNRQTTSVSEGDAGFDILNTQRFADATIEEHIISHQIEQDIRAMVDGLPEEQREVIQMRYFQGMSFKEIADATNVSINTALGRVRYALINLRKMAHDNRIILSA